MHCTQGSKMGDPSNYIEESSSETGGQELVKPVSNSENTPSSKIKLQLELSVNNEQEAVASKMSGRLFKTTPDRENGDTTNTISIPGVHTRLTSESVGGGGPDMTSSPNSEHQPHSFSEMGGVVGSGRTGHSGINLHLDLRGCTDRTVTGHPLQRVVTPSPVATPMAQAGGNEFPLSSKPGHALNRTPFQSFKKEETSGKDEDYCQCHNNNNNINKEQRRANKPPIFTTQESVQEPTAGLRQYPNGQRYLCTSCRTEVKSEQGSCPTCPHSTDCSAFSSLESGGQRGGFLGSNNYPYHQPPQPIGAVGIKSHEMAINMPPYHNQQQCCDRQNRENEHSSVFLSGYESKEVSKDKWRWLKKPCVYVPLCMLLCIIISVGAFYCISRRDPHPTVVVNSDSENTTARDLTNPLYQLQQDRICVKCINLRLSADRADDFTTNLLKVPNPDNEDEMLCCARSASEIQQILDAILETRVRQEQNFPVPRPRSNITTTFGTRNNLAALLYLGRDTSEDTKDPSEDTSSQEEEDSSTKEDTEDDTGPHIDSTNIIYGWTNITQSQSGFIRSHIFFDKNRGRLKVTQNGLYHVYTKMSFRPDPLRPNKGVIFTQKIMKENFRFQKRGPIQMLKDTQYSPCPNIDTNHACHSSSLSAVLYLQRGDELFVEASHGSFLMRDKLSSYFGLYYID